MVITTVSDTSKLDGVVDSFPPDEGCEVLDEEMNEEEWDKNGNKNVTDSNDTHNLINWGSL